MSTGLTLASLSLPAMLGAGLSSSAHCAVMCGLLQARQSGKTAVARHLGRLGAYALLGAIAGGAGQWLLRTAAWLPAGEGFRVALVSALLLALLLRARRGGTAACCRPLSSTAAPLSTLQQATTGFATALVPCAPLYAAAAYATLSASAANGALLLLAFGVGTVPAVQAGAWTWARVGRSEAGVRMIREVPLLVGLLTSLALLLIWLATAQQIFGCLN